ncbi:FAD-dependent oxidoreductase [Ruegeria sp. YS9]|uniref:hydroxysqualene dehydroxylase n=1 Tax=Ruegeria sp. YS9 TaxID=2966453 RepID=UPI00214C9BE5|nr:FAD-dependent oxidoreductase [Ruegeria sp. YS9]UUV08395.1 NAD(P)-binding protein [Ruegeria sp. YS9]
MPDKVVILGGGVAGMSAAHELIERGFEVEVHERQLIPGGKARSIPVMKGEGDHGSKAKHIKALEKWAEMDGASYPPGVKRPWLPGEHGFRFFPNFYRHITDTMARTPYYDKGTCFDNLVPTTQVLVSQFDKPGIIVPERFPRTLKDVADAFKTIAFALSPRDQIAYEDVEHFVACMWRIASSCKERRFDEYERIGWWDFIGAQDRSEAYQKFLAIGLTRSLVAAKATTASTKTVGDIAIQLQLGIATPEPHCNRLLNGPTNLVWIQPWLDYLTSKGVVYNFDSKVTGIECRNGRIIGATVEQDGKEKQVTGDWFISAMPIERMAPLVTPEMMAVDPALAKLPLLANDVQWMNGIQFYLTKEVELTHGHVIFIDSPWALTAVSQKQFWHQIDFDNWAEGKTKGLLSIDISEWDKPGLNGKTARNCSREEIASEVWEQVKRGINVDGQTVLRDEDMHYWFLDPDIVQDPNDPKRQSNVEPLLVNRINSWRLRPDAATLIPNFFLASDYVRTFTDLATMEGANEAARRAVNAILQRSGSDAEPCQIWDLHEPDILKPLRAYDYARYQAGLPWDNRFAVAVEAALRMGQDTAGVERGGDGPLAAIGEPATEYSKPGGITEEPAIAEALRMICPPKELFDLIANYEPTADLPIPGDELAEDVAYDLGRDSGQSGALSRALPVSDAPLSVFGAGSERSGAREDKSRVIITQKG